MKLKMFAPWKERYDKPRQCIKKQRYHFANKGPNNQNFASSPVWMWELTTKKAVKWKLKVFVSSRQILYSLSQQRSPQRLSTYELTLSNCGKTLEHPLHCKESRPVHPKGNEPWILIGKDPDAGKDWGGDGGNRRWDSWMASPTQWTWIWASSRRWWRSGKPGVLLSMGLQRARHDLATEQQQMGENDLKTSIHDLYN